MEKNVAGEGDVPTRKPPALQAGIGISMVTTLLENEMLSW